MKITKKQCKNLKKVKNEIYKKNEKK